MDGIEILNQTEIMKSVWSWDVFWTTFFLFLGLSLIISFIIGLDRFEVLNSLIMGAIIGIISGGVMGGTFASIIYQVPSGTYEYQVTISEDVNFVEFNEKYEIIKQDGKIYTVVEKDTDKS